MMIKFAAVHLRYQLWCQRLMYPVVELVIWSHYVQFYHLPSKLTLFQLLRMVKLLVLDCEDIWSRRCRGKFYQNRDSRARHEHYHTKTWPPRNEFMPGNANTEHEPMIDPKKILLPPLHIKLGLIKQFIKKLDHQSRAFLYLKNELFSRLSDAKLKEGVLVGPQIRKMMKDLKFESLLKVVEKNAWKCFKDVVNGFLGNNKAANLSLISKLIRSYEKMGCLMNLKIHFLD